MGFIVRIPFDPKSESSRPLKRCLNAAAQANGVTDFMVAYIMSDFFTQLAAEVASGNIVHIPAIGKFGACSRRTRTGSNPAPRLYTSNPFHQEVLATCSPRKAERNTETLRTFGRYNHPSSRKGKTHSRVFTSMAAFKKDLKKQERELGMI